MKINAKSSQIFLAVVCMILHDAFHLSLWNMEEIGCKFRNILFFAGFLKFFEIFLANVFHVMYKRKGISTSMAERGM